MVKSRNVIVKKQFVLSGKENAAFIKTKSEKNSIKFINEIERISDKIV